MKWIATQNTIHTTETIVLGHESVWKESRVPVGGKPNQFDGFHETNPMALLGRPKESFLVKERQTGERTTNGRKGFT